MSASPFAAAHSDSGDYVRLLIDLSRSRSTVSSLLRCNWNVCLRETCYALSSGPGHGHLFDARAPRRNRLKSLYPEPVRRFPSHGGIQTYPGLAAYPRQVVEPVDAVNDFLEPTVRHMPPSRTALVEADGTRLRVPNSVNDRTVKQKFHILDQFRQDRRNRQRRFPPPCPDKWPPLVELRLHDEPPPAEPVSRNHEEGTNQAEQEPPDQPSRPIRQPAARQSQHDTQPEQEPKSHPLIAAKPCPVERSYPASVGPEKET